MNTQVLETPVLFPPQPYGPPRLGLMALERSLNKRIWPLSLAVEISSGPCRWEVTVPALSVLLCALAAPFGPTVWPYCIFATAGSTEKTRTPPEHRDTRKIWVHQLHAVV